MVLIGLVAGTQTAHAADNPPLPDSCGLDIAIVLDLSSSLTDSDVADSKEAATAFVTALTSTPSAVGVYTFSDNADTVISKSSISTGGQASAVKDAINEIDHAGGWTNWQAGFTVVPTGDYDAIVFITDGEPNRPVGNGLGYGIAAADTHKAAGTTIIGIGVGNVNDDNIKAISGDILNEDYYLVDDYSELAANMEEIAKKTCDGTLSVTKQVKDVNGDTAPAAGWTFDADGDILGDASKTTGDNGTVNFKVDYSDGNTDTKTVTVTEQQQAGYQLEQQSDANAVCTANGQQVPVTNVTNGFSVEVPASAIVSCTVINQQLEQADLTLTNDVSGTFERTYEWDLTKTVDRDSAEILVGDKAEFHYEITATPSVVDESGFVVNGTATLTNPNDLAVTGVNVVASLPGADCTVTDGTGLTVPANDAVEVNYSCTLDDGAADFTGTVTVDADWDASALPGSTGATTVDTAIDFAAVTPTVINGTVTVYDDKADKTVELDAADGQAVLSYTLEVTANSVGCQEFVNTATLTGDGDYTLTATATVTVCADNPPPTETPTPTPTPTTPPVDNPTPTPTPTPTPELADTGSTTGLGVIVGGLAVIAVGGFLLTRGLTGRRER